MSDGWGFAIALSLVYIVCTGIPAYMAGRFWYESENFLVFVWTSVLLVAALVAPWFASHYTTSVTTLVVIGIVPLSGVGCYAFLVGVYTKANKSWQPMLFGASGIAYALLVPVVILASSV